MKNGIKTLAMWLIIGIIFIVVLSSIVENSDSKLKYSDLIADINSGKVESIQVESDGKKAIVQLKDEKIRKEVNIPDMQSFMAYTEDFLKEGAFTLEEKSESIFITILSLLTPFGLLIIFFIFWFFMMGGANNGNPGSKTMSFGKNRARMMTPAEKNKITFEDVAGVDEEKEELEEAYKNNKTIKVVVKEEIKGGLAAYYGSIRVFIPASQAARERIELKNLLGKELEVKLIELDLRNRKVVASRRVIEEEIYNAHKKELWKNVKSGEKREGVVTKILKVGAIVDIGGITGLIHISDLAWEKVKRVEDVVSVGDKVVVFVGNVDAENEKVSLILKDVNNEPWNLHRESLKEGNVLEGKVAKLLNFGAFVEVFPGVEGLVHINEITDENIAKPSEALEIGQIVKVKILNADIENKKLSLSIRDAVEKSQEYLAYNDSDEGETLGDLFKGLFDN